MTLRFPHPKTMKSASAPGQLRGRALKVVSFAPRLAVVGMLLSGCAALGGGPSPLDTYDLTAPDVDSRGRRNRTQILIAEPTALKVLDGQNIVIKTGPGAIEYLGGAQWADRLPRVVQARLGETFQRSDAFAGVGKPGEGLAIDYQITTEIREFEIRVDGQARAEVEFYVRILNDRNGVVRAAKTFAASAPLAGQAGNAAYVAALDAAFDEVATEIVTWADSLI